LDLLDGVASRVQEELDARALIGVRRVRKHLKLRPQTILSDEELEERINRALWDDEYVEYWEIEVDASAGRIYLWGRWTTPLRRRGPNTGPNTQWSSSLSSTTSIMNTNGNGSRTGRFAKT
jgi:hypothetical protein